MSSSTTPSQEHEATELYAQPQPDQPVADRTNQVIELDDYERAALAHELREYADYREGDLYLDTNERAAELSADPSYAYDEQAVAEGLEHEHSQIAQLQQEQVAAASPYRDLADQVEQTGRLDLTDEAVRSDVTEVINNASWQFGGDEQVTPPPTMRRVVEAVEASRRPDQERAARIHPHPTDGLREDARARDSADDATLERAQTAAAPERGETVAGRLRRVLADVHARRETAPRDEAERHRREEQSRDSHGRGLER